MIVTYLDDRVKFYFWAIKEKVVKNIMKAVHI